MLSLVQYLWFILSDKNQKRPKCFCPENYHCLSPTIHLLSFSTSHRKKFMSWFIRRKSLPIQWFTFFYGSFLFSFYKSFFFASWFIANNMQCFIWNNTKISYFLLLFLYRLNLTKSKSKPRAKAERFLFNGKWGFCKMLIKYKNFARHLLYRFKKWCQVLGGKDQMMLEKVKQKIKIVALDLLYFDKLFNWIENVSLEK